MPIKHNTLTTELAEGEKISSTEWDDSHDISTLTLDEIAEGTTNKAFTSTLKSKLDGIAAAAEVNVNADWNASSGDAQILNKPTIPSTTADIADSANKRYVTDAQLTVLGNTSGTNTGDQNLSGYFNKSTDDLDDITEGTINKAFTSTLKDKLDGIEAGAKTGDVVGDDTSTTAQNIVAYTGTGGKNITELTGTQGDILYHNGTSWAKLGAGTVGQYLETNGADANPSWSYGAIIHSSKSAGATTTAANTTPVSVTDAVFSYVASAVYRIWVMGRLNSAAATTGAAIQFDLSSAVTAIDVIGGNLLASNGTATFFASVADDTTLGSGSSGVPAGPVDVPIFAHGLLVTGANTGTCQLRLRSETTAVTELLAGVVMVVERVA